MDSEKEDGINSLTKSQFVEVLEKNPAIIVIVDADRKVIYANRQAKSFSKAGERILGLGPGIALNCIHALSNPKGCGYGASCQTCKVRETVQKTIDSGESFYDIECAIKLGEDDNSEKNELLVSTTHLNLDGKNTVVVTIQDITEIIKDQELMRLQSLTLSQIQDSLIVTDLKGNVTYANYAAEKKLGKKHDELIGSNISEFGDEPSEGATHEEIIKKVEENGSWWGEVVNYASDGTKIYFDSRVFRVNSDSGEPIAYCGISTDVTEKKIAQFNLNDMYEAEKALTNFSKDLYDPNVTDLGEAFVKLLHAAKADRVYAFENFTDSNGVLYMRHTVEAVVEGVKPQINNMELNCISYDSKDLMEFRRILESGLEISGKTEDFNEEIRKILESQNIKYLLIIPYKIYDKWAGFIGFDSVRDGVIWGENEVRLLRLASEIYGNYLSLELTKKDLGKKAEEFKTITENSADAIFITDLSGKYTYVNKASCELLGYTSDELTSMNIADISSKADLEKNLRDFKNLIESGSMTVEVNLNSKDGQTIPVELNAVVLPDKRIYGSCREIKTRLERLKKLKMHSELLNATSDAIMLHDLDANFIFVNKATCERYGYSYEQLTSMKVSDLDSPRASRDFEMKIQKILDTGSLIFEGEHVSSDGTVIPVELSSNVIEYGGHKQILTIARDISLQKKTLKKLELSEKRHRLLLETIFDPVVLTDKKGKIIYINQAGLDAVGAKKEDVVGENALNLPFFTVKSKAIIAQKLAESSLYGVGDGYEIQIINKVKAVRDFELRYVEYDFEMEKGWLVLLRDVTEEKTIQQEIRKFKTIADMALAGVAISDLKGNIKYSNEYFARIHGYEQKELIGKHLSVFHTKNQLNHVNEINKEIFAHGGFSSEIIWHVTRDGREFPMLMSTTLIKNDVGEPEYIAAMAVDASEKIDADKRLEQTKLIIDISPVIGITWGVGEGWPVEFVTENIHRLLGVESEELISGKIKYSDLIHSKDFERVTKEVQKAIDSGDSEFTHEPYRLMGLDGGEKWFTDWTRIERDADGNPVKFRGVLFEITQAKEAQDELNKRMKQLEVFKEATVDEILDFKKLEEENQELRRRLGDEG